MGSHSTCVEHKSTATRHLFLVNPSLSFPRSYPLSGSFEVEHEEDQRRYHGVSTYYRSPIDARRHSQIIPHLIGAERKTWVRRGDFVSFPVHICLRLAVGLTTDPIGRKFPVSCHSVITNRVVYISCRLKTAVVGMI